MLCYLFNNIYSNLWRSKDKEKAEQEKLMEYDIVALRKAAECHRQIRKYAQSIIQPGMKMVDICVQIENMLKFITNANGIECGQAFPTGCSLNHCAAHYTPNPGDQTVLDYNDVCKIDFGTQVGGNIIDCAFTVAFNPTYDNLLKASKEATLQGVKLAGIDARLGEIGAGIQEVLESYEVEIGGKTRKIKAIRNLCGHTMDHFKVHAGKSVPIVQKEDNTKMEEGELYAIETFASTGKGYVEEDKDCSHFMKDELATDASKVRGDKAKALFNFIDKHFSTMAFCRRWLDDGGFPQHALALKQLVDAHMINKYPPLSDIEGCYVSQFEHTLMLKPTSKEVFSFGDDY
jgi:methionyl aminopeptidase